MSISSGAIIHRQMKNNNHEIDIHWLVEYSPKIFTKRSALLDVKLYKITRNKITKICETLHFFYIITVIWTYRHTLIKE